MALDMQGLFTNPAEIRAQRVNEIMKQQQALSGQGGTMAGLLAQVAGGGNVMGQMLAEGIAQATGMKTQEEKQAAEAQSVLGKIDPNDPNSYYQAADRLQKAGLTKAAFAIMQKGQDLANVKFGQDVKTQELALSAGRLALDNWKANKLDDNQKAEIAIARERLGIDKERYEDMDANDKARIANEVDRIRLAQKADKREEDKTEREKQVDSIIADVSYIAGDDAATYYDSIAERLTFEGYGREASDYAKKAEDIRKGRKINQGADDYRTVKDFVNQDGKVGTVILKNGEQIGFYETEADAPEISTTDNKTLKEAITNANSTASAASSADQLAKRLEKLENFGGGAALTAEEAYRQFAGLRDERSQVITAAQNLINSNVLDMLPPGAASDADVQLVKAGAPQPDAGRDELISYARAVARVNRAANKWNSQRAEWISTYKNEQGFNMDQTLQGMEFQKRNTDPATITAMQQIIDNAPNEAERQNAIDLFERELKFNPYRMAELKKKLYNITKDARYQQ